MAFKVNINGNVQYASREAGIKAHAEDYSFNIESELFYQLSPEQQKLWRKEIEQAVLSGGYCGLELAKDKRYDEEPVSDDLEQAIDTYLSTYFGGEKEKQNWPFLKKMAIHFAEWQKEQFENNRLKHCDSITNEQAELEQGFIDQHLDKYQRMPTFLDAIEYGMRLQKAQMMAKAIDGEVGYWNLRGLSINTDLPRSVSEGDKVKIIVIKED